MFDITEYIQDLIDSGMSREEACAEAKSEMAKRRNHMKTAQVEYENDYTDWFRQNCDKYKR